MRVYPKGLRVSSSNLDPAPFWRLGVQMVALNWQNLNAAIMLNQAMFQGTEGWVLKPRGYRDGKSDPMNNRIQRGTLNLSIDVLAGQHLAPSSRHVRPYISCELHVEEPKEQTGEELPEGGESKDGEFKTRTEVGRGSSEVDFQRQRIEFKGIRGATEDLTLVR
jgi:hypothetical protein